MEYKKCLPVVIGGALESGPLIWKTVDGLISAFGHLSLSLLGGERSVHPPLAAFEGLHCTLCDAA